jgi:hypothetical protein
MAGGVTTAPRPDLIPLPARDVSVAHIRRVNVDLLAFAATVWNAGPGPLLVEGFRPGDPPFMPATQYFVSDGSIVGQARAGDFHYDNRPTHKHWHFEDFATYQLVNRVTGHTVVSGKQSFCLAPTDAVDLTAPGSEFRPDEIGLGSICGDISSIWLREMLPVGWGDTYVQSRAGQAFNITGVPNGDYDIRVVTNPDQRLYESDYTNNVSTLHVRLGGSRGDRTVAVVS